MMEMCAPVACAGEFFVMLLSVPSSGLTDHSGQYVAVAACLGQGSRVFRLVNKQTLVAYALIDNDCFMSNCPPFFLDRFPPLDWIAYGPYQAFTRGQPRLNATLRPLLIQFSDYPFDVAMRCAFSTF